MSHLASHILAGETAHPTNTAKPSQGGRKALDAEQGYRSLFEQCPRPMWIADRDTSALLAVNNAAACLFGCSRDELLAGTVRELRVRNDRPARTIGELTLQTASYTVSHCQLRKSDGRIFATVVTSYPVLFQGRPCRCELVSDPDQCSDIQASPAESAGAGPELQEFVFMTWHDLQGPLRTVASHAQLLTRKYQGRTGECSTAVHGPGVAGGSGGDLPVVQLSR